MAARNYQRDLEILQRSKDGASIATISAEFDLTEQRIGQILTRMRGNLSLQTKSAVRAEFAAQIDEMRAVVAGILELKAAPLVRSNEHGLLYVKDPETGDYVREHGVHLQAVDRMLKLQERAAKLLGVDAPVETISESTVNYTLKGEVRPDDI